MIDGSLTGGLTDCRLERTITKEDNGEESLEASRVSAKQAVRKWCSIATPRQRHPLGQRDGTVNNSVAGQI